MMVVGVVGGGQLARMMLQESIPLGLDLRFMVSSPDDPVAQVSAYCSVGSPTSPADLERFAHTVDVMTFDHEVVDLAALEHLEANGHLLAPDAASFATVSDKARMRAALTSAGIPVPEAVVTEDAEHISRLVAARGPQVLKVAHGGYDGRGTFFVDDPAEASRIASATDGPLLVEPRLDLIAELAAIVVIGRDGGRVGYDPVLTIQVEGQCRRIDAPAALSDEIIESARELAGAAAEAVGATGVVATELFLTSEGLLVNELAARPHNTGHHTLDAAVTSQFSNHLRAVSGLPLGDPSLRQPAVTANVIGRDATIDPRQRREAALALDPGAHIHLYGKAPRTDRKLGHVTVCDDDHDRAVARVAAVVEVLGGQEVPR